MLFQLHFWLAAAGENAITVLLGVYMQTYTDGSTTEIGGLLMVMPFLGLFMRPIICSIADRHQAHQKCMIYCLLVVTLSYIPFILVPLLGPEVYEQQPRLCWWFLVVLKVIGDIAYGGVLSLADSLTVNYSKRIGTEFGTYRVWSTFSWMFFGFITGQINEVPFLPKYVPAFIILCLTALMDAFVCWLWHPEFFRMVAMDPNEALEGKPKEVKQLMPNEELLAHMKEKLMSVLNCRRSTDKPKSMALADISVEPIGGHFGGKGFVSPDQEQKVGLKIQLLLLAALFRKDPRLTIYLMFFVVAGATMVPISFFFMSLSEICNQQGTCNFSKLGGYLQVSMACVEAVLFGYIATIVKFTGRVNLCAIALALASFKFLFYGTVWVNLNPHWALLIEPIFGILVGCYVILTVELGHKFANEVEYIIPQMIERGIIEKNVNVDKVRLSLSATMLAVISAALDGIGRGIGALIYGILLAYYSYESLWLMIGIFFGLACLTAVAVSIFDRVFQPNLGLDVRAKMASERKCNNIERNNSSSTINSCQVSR